MNCAAHNSVRGALPLALVVLALLAGGARAQDADSAEPQKPEEARLIDRIPFDRIILKEGGVAVDVQLLDLPDRRVPNPLPTSGSLKIRRLEDPTNLYELNWTDVARVQLYEEVLLDEARRLSSAGESAEAFEYLAFLHKNYPNLQGVDAAIDTYLQDDATRAFRGDNFEEALAILLALYDRNPGNPRLAGAVRAVSDRMITAHLERHDYSAARGVLELLKQAFPRLSLPNIALWEKQFADDAAEQLAEARAAMERSDYSAAREAVRSAQGILPSAPGAVELMEEIQDTWPQVVVGVAELAPEGADPLVCWAAARVNPLLEERLVRLIDFGNEGPVFQCPWAEIQTDDTGEVLSVTPNQKAEACGVTPDRLALGLLAMVDPHNRDYAVGLAASLREVSLAEGRIVELLCRNHIRPESLLDVPLSAISPTALGQYTIGPREAQRATYLAREAAAGSPKAIVEQAFPSDGEALHALVTGQVDALDRVPPWRVDTVTGDRNLRLGTYRLPTVHVLLLNFDNPLLGRAEFRRALAYGIDRERLLSEILLAGKTRPGFQVVSGPLPAGVSLTDPVGDSYNRQIRPRPYAPRLASLLAKVSRIAILKPYEKKEGDDSAATPGDPPDVERPLVLLHGADPVATTACQSIGRQLSAIGIPVELKRLDNSGAPLPEHDLYYCELSMGEPLNDVRRLLGPQGLAGRCTPAMSVALDQLDRIESWNAAREKLGDIHELAHNDLPVVPLWQTVNHFACRKSLTGVGRSPVSLYQNVDAWRLSADGGAR